MFGFKKELVSNSIGESSFFEGSFSIKGSIRIDGRYEGKLLESAQIFVGPKGKVKANINTENIIIEGIVIGDIKAKERVFMLPSSKVLGNVRAPEIIVQNGVVMEGKCYIDNKKVEEAGQYIETLYNESSA